jgi:hypothetical protein
MVGAKLLMELVLMLSQRLRSTGDRLVGLLDKGPDPAVDAAADQAPALT